MAKAKRSKNFIIGILFLDSSLARENDKVFRTRFCESCENRRIWTDSALSTQEVNSKIVDEFLELC